jgi:hypothetical protein
VRAFLILMVLTGCHSLPSGAPLSNTGGILEDDGTARDRRASSDSEPHTDATVAHATTTAVPRALPSAAPDAPSDAGVAPPPSKTTEATKGEPVWPGDYYGSDKLVRHFEEEADDVELDDKAHTRIEQPSPGALLISVVNSASGETICALHATAHGADASLDPGQACFNEEGADASVTSGKVTLAGDRLMLDFSGKVVAEMDDDGDTLEFTLDYHFDGRRR